MEFGHFTILYTVTRRRQQQVIDFKKNLDILEMEKEQTERVTDRACACSLVESLCSQKVIV